MTRFRIAGVQMDVAIGDKQSNLEQMERHIRQTASVGARLTVFPECALAGYCFDSLEEARPFAETIPGPATERLSTLCRELDVFAVFGLLETDGDRLFNACTLVGSDGVVGSYRKIHLPYLGIDRSFEQRARRQKSPKPLSEAQRNYGRFLLACGQTTGAGMTRRASDHSP